MLLGVFEAVCITPTYCFKGQAKQQTMTTDKSAYWGLTYEPLNDQIYTLWIHPFGHAHTVYNRLYKIIIVEAKQANKVYIKQRWDKLV